MHMNHNLHIMTTLKWALMQQKCGNWKFILKLQDYDSSLDAFNILFFSNKH